MNPRTASLVILLLLAVCILPASGATMRIVSWTSTTGEYTTYSWLIYDPPATLNLFGVQTPLSAHFSDFYSDCEWRSELSRYDDKWVRNLQALSRNDMWAYSYRTTAGTVPSSVMMAYTTSSSYRPGLATYAMISGSDIMYGTTIAPTLSDTTNVSEPVSIIALLSGVAACAAKRRR